MSLESKSANKLQEYGKAANTLMTPEIGSSLQKSAIAGAVTWVLPLFGAETILYAFILWNMYAKITKLANRKFGFSAICGGFFINLLICLVGNLVLELFDVFMGLGFILSAICGYCATYQSGKSFLGYLAKN